MYDNIQKLEDEFFFQTIFAQIALSIPQKQWLETQIHFAKHNSDIIKFIVNHFKVHTTQKFPCGIIPCGIARISRHHWMVNVVFFNHCIDIYNQHAQYVAQYTRSHQKIKLPFLRKYHQLH